MSYHHIKAFEALNKHIDGLPKEEVLSVAEFKGMMMQFSSDAYKTPASGKDMAELLTDFVNVAGSQSTKEFADRIVTSHRTLQEELFQLFIMCVEKWAEMHDTDRYDARNMYTVTTSKQIVEKILK